MTTRHATAARREADNREAALNAFIATKTEIDEMLERLQALSDDHFNPSRRDRLGDVGTLSHYASLLRQITDSAFSEGEHAE